MSKGFLIFASGPDYLQQAYALALSIKHTQKEVTSVALMTNDDVPKKHSKAFDHIVEIPWTDNVVETRYCAEHRWKLFYSTPYEETIVLDADMIMLEDVTDWWTYLKNTDLKFCSVIKNYKLDIIEKDTVHRRAFIDNQLTNPYYACFYFKKSEYTFNFFKVLEFVCNNWEWCYTEFAPISYQNRLSMDLAAAIAIEITGYHKSVIDVCNPMQFVHMKPGIQGWTALPGSWQDAVPYVVNSKGELVVGNIKQPKLFHYIENDFLSKKIISRLEELNRG